MVSDRKEDIESVRQSKRQRRLEGAYMQRRERGMELIVNVTANALEQLDLEQCDITQSFKKRRMRTPLALEGHGVWKKVEAPRLLAVASILWFKRWSRRTRMDGLKLSAHCLSFICFERSFKLFIFKVKMEVVFIIYRLR